jgi:hypothetical protein
MFGCVGCYLEGRLVVVLADRREPWQGLLFPVERAVQPLLRKEFPALRVHPVLRKWLYLPSAGRAFAGSAEEIVSRIAGGDARFGVEPKAPRLPRRRI